MANFRLFSLCRIYICICCRFKQKTEAQAILIRLAFAHHANRSLSFVCLFTKKQREVCKRTK